MTSRLNPSAVNQLTISDDQHLECNTILTSIGWIWLVETTARGGGACADANAAT